MLTPPLGCFTVSLTLSLLLALLLPADGSQPWRVPSEQGKRRNPVPSTLESLTTGAKLFREQCAVCHGLKGDGQSHWATMFSQKPADLTNAALMRTRTDGEIFWKITTGRDLMPPFAEKLSEAERWHLVNYLRSLARPEARGGRDSR